MNSGPSFVSFDSEGLLFKGGFGDGDMLDDLMDAAGHADRNRGFHHLVLCRVVEELVIPRLRQKVITYRCDTGHNPSRAIEIDGQPIDWDDGLGLPWVRLEPVEVDVAVASILLIADDVAANAERYSDDG